MLFFEGTPALKLTRLPLDDLVERPIDSEVRSVGEGMVTQTFNLVEEDGLLTVITVEDLHEPGLDRGAVRRSNSRAKRLRIKEDDLDDSFPGNEVLVIHCRWVPAQNEKVWTGNVQGRVSLAHGWLRFGLLAVASKRNLQRRGAIVNLDGAILLVVQFVG